MSMNLGAPIGEHDKVTPTYAQTGLSELQGNNNSGGVIGNSSTPIADRFSGPNTSKNTGNEGLGGRSEAVSGAYEGGAVGDALTGESHAQRTGAGVGPLGENLGTYKGVDQGLGVAGIGADSTATGSNAYQGTNAYQSGGQYDGQTGGHHHHHHHHHHHNNTTGEGIANNQNSSSNYTSTAPLTKETPTSAAGYGSGVGAEGGAGGHYTRDDNTQAGALAAGTGVVAGEAGYGGQRYESGRDQVQPIQQGDSQYQNLDSTGTGVYDTTQGQTGSYDSTQGQGLSGSSNDNSALNTTDLNTNSSGNAAGHYGKADDGDFNRGAPVSDPKDIDTGGPHSLVYQESTGKYVHRRDL